jgi:uncharacterized delta-60 repeat protein
LLIASAFWAAAGEARTAKLRPSFGSFQLDRSFGDGGIVARSGPHVNGEAAAGDSSGRIIVVADLFRDNGMQRGVQLSRYARSGRLDPSFGSGGTLTTVIRSPASKDQGDVSSIAVDDAGRIVVAGEIPAVNGDFQGGFVARFLPDGSVDTSFGRGGVATAIPGGGFNALAIDRRGRIVAAGFGHSPRRPQLAVARFGPTGGLDPGFGTGGIVTVASQKFPLGEAHAITLDGRRRIVLAGQLRGFVKGGGFVSHFGLVRLAPDGSRDASFGAHGTVATAIGSPRAVPTSAQSVAIPPDGGISVAGQAYYGGEKGWQFTLARYRPNGRLDAAFGRDGIAHKSFGPHEDAFAAALAIDGDGRITVGGSATAPCEARRPLPPCHGVPDSNELQFAIARYRPNGEPARAFGVDGRARTVIGTESEPGALVPEGRHRAVLVGQATRRGSHLSTLALARYLTRPVRR